jgi:4-hydroxyphenylacetate 3-monooxygenase
MEHDERSSTAMELMSAREYVDSLRDARAVYLYGERVKDVTTHPAFRNSVRSVARLYDTLADPRQRDALTTTDRFGIRTHRFFTSSYSAQELLAARDAVARWARLTYGFMGRTPDYKASFMATLGANPEFYAPFEDNALNWYRRYAARGLYLNHVLINPPVPQSARARGGRRLSSRRAGDGFRSDRQRCENAGDGVGTHACDVRRAEQRRHAGSR